MNLQNVFAWSIEDLWAAGEAVVLFLLCWIVWFLAPLGDPETGAGRKND